MRLFRRPPTKALPLLACALLVCVFAALVAAQTPGGLVTLESEYIGPPAQRDFKRLGVTTRDLRPLEHFHRGPNHEGFFIAYESQELGIMGILARPYVKIADDPDDQEKHPLIILNHGSKHGISAPYRAIALELASRGYIVLASSYRGMAGAEGRSEGVFKMGKGAVLDVLQLTQLGRQLPYVDTLRMGVLGFGYGGLFTLLAIERSNVFQAAVAVAPPVFSPYGEFGFAGRDRLPQLFEKYLGYPLTRDRLFNELNERETFQDARRITTPLLLIASDQDPSYRDLRRFSRELRQHSVEHRFVAYEQIEPRFMTAAGVGNWPARWHQIRDRAWWEVFNFLDQRLAAPEEETASQ